MDPLSILSAVSATASTADVKVPSPVAMQFVRKPLPSGANGDTNVDMMLMDDDAESANIADIELDDEHESELHGDAIAVDADDGDGGDEQDEEQDESEETCCIGCGNRFDVNLMDMPSSEEEFAMNALCPAAFCAVCYRAGDWKADLPRDVAARVLQAADPFVELYARLWAHVAKPMMAAKAEVKARAAAARDKAKAKADTDRQAGGTSNESDRPRRKRRRRSIRYEESDDDKDNAPTTDEAQEEQEEEEREQRRPKKRAKVGAKAEDEASPVAEDDDSAAAHDPIPHPLQQHQAASGSSLYS